MKSMQIASIRRWFSSLMSDIEAATPDLLS
jgi:hypothetical protein